MVKNNNNFKRFYLQFLFILLAFLGFNKVFSQTSDQVNIQNLTTLNVDELTDDQLDEFWTKAQAQGVTIATLQVEATRRKMPKAELAKLIDRIENLPQKSSVKNYTDDSNLDQEKKEKKVTKKVDEFAELFDNLIPKPFGAELFTNSNISFEPNMKIATPLSYVLGPDDELIVDIYGYSEDSYKVKVSAEGYVKLPYAGMLMVSGLTVEQAKQRIIAKLSPVFSRINSGQTNVNVALGAIRSIKVIILGEVNKPGTYTLSSLATVFNALYASGGPNENGSFRNIKIIRNNKVVSNLDVYEFILKGDAKGNIRLQDNDIIQIPAYKNRVEIKGEIKRWAYYEVKPKEALTDLLNFTGGFNPNAYTERIKVIRNTGKEKGVADVENTKFSQFLPTNGDVFIVGKLLDRFENRVLISGAVFRPGLFALTKGLTLKELINKADGLREDAFLTRAIIYRLKPDNNLEMLSVNLLNLMDGKIDDIELKREDKIKIASKLDMQELKTITVNGEVAKPGVFDFAENMTVEDIIVAAGGFKEGGSNKRIEIARRIYNADKTNLNAEAAIVASFDANEELISTGKDFLLNPFDVVTIYLKPGFVKQEIMKIEGEVFYPGVYTISKRNEKISEIITRAGGLTAQAFPEGAILLRSKQQTITEDVITKNKLRALKKQSKDTTETKDVIEEETNKTFDIVGIDLKKALNSPGSKHDIFIREGDVLRIPVKKQSVLVTGEVLYPVRIIYQSGKGFKSYVNGAGGYTNKALKRRSYVIYPNGQAKATKKLLVFNLYPKVKPGSEIVVPLKEEKKGVSTVEVATILTSLTSLLFVVITLSK